MVIKREAAPANLKTKSIECFQSASWAGIGFSGYPLFSICPHALHSVAGILRWRTSGYCCWSVLSQPEISIRNFQQSQLDFYPPGDNEAPLQIPSDRAKNRWAKINALRHRLSQHFYGKTGVGDDNFLNCRYTCCRPAKRGPHYSRAVLRSAADADGIASGYLILGWSVVNFSVVSSGAFLAWFAGVMAFIAARIIAIVTYFHPAASMPGHLLHVLSTWWSDRSMSHCSLLACAISPRWIASFLVAP